MRSSSVIPAISGRHFSEISAKIDLVADFVEWVHIDIADGEFGSPASWPYAQGGIDRAVNEMQTLLLHHPNLFIELHLMVSDPSIYLQIWKELPIKRFLIHAESKNCHQIISQLKSCGFGSGIVLNFQTPVEIVSEFKEETDYFQLMAIKSIGHYGEKFDTGVLARIRKLREILPGAIISVDGGLNSEFASDSRLAGANQIVAGSAIFKSNDSRLAIKSFSIN